MPDDPIPAAADVWGEAAEAEPTIDLDDNATGLDAMLRRAAGTDGQPAALTEADVRRVFDWEQAYGDVTERRRQGVTFEDDAPLRERADWGHMTRPEPAPTDQIIVNGDMIDTYRMAARPTITGFTTGRMTEGRMTMPAPDTRLADLRRERDEITGEVHRIRTERRRLGPVHPARRGMTQAIQRRNDRLRALTNVITRLQAGRIPPPLRPLEEWRRTLDVGGGFHLEPDQEYATPITDRAPAGHLLLRDEPVAPWTMRRGYGLTEPLRVFSDWEEVEDGNFGCRWPFNPCGAGGTWVRTVWLDAAPNLQLRIPFPTLCETHWMNRGQLTLDIPDALEEGVTLTWPAPPPAFTFRPTTRAIPPINVAWAITGNQDGLGQAMEIAADQPPGYYGADDPR